MPPQLERQPLAGADEDLRTDHALPPEQGEEIDRFLVEQREAIIEAGTSWVVETAVDLRGRRPRDETRALVARVVDAHVARLLHDDPEPQRRFIEFVTTLRASDRFHISTLIRGFSSFKKGVEQVLPGSSLSPPDQLRLLISVDACTRESILEMSDLYVGKLSHELDELREARAVDVTEAPVQADQAGSVPSMLEELFAESTPPPRVGRYQVNRVIGRGGMGTVLEAHDERLDRKVALKLLHPSIAGRHAQRLLREAKALAKLSHPNVVQVYEVGEDHGQTFIAMELVCGETLSQWQAQRPPWRVCVERYIQAGTGLAAAHVAGLTHRDFKPDNCIVDQDGRVRVLDFGLVRGLDDDGERELAGSESLTYDDSTSKVSCTVTGAVLGTLAYMPLEQLEGATADERSDQFSFCVSLYEALYGQRPFAAVTVERLMIALGAGEVRAAPRRSRVPARLRRALLRGLSKEPRDRWPSMDALLAELESILHPRRRGLLGAGLLAATLLSLTMAPWVQGASSSVDEPSPRLVRAGRASGIAARLALPALRRAWSRAGLAVVRER